MTRTDLDMQMNERRDEFFALINIIGYAAGIAHSLGASSAVSNLDAARQALVADLQAEFPSVLCKDGIAQAASARAGHC
jgi:hypothetical protein